MTRAILKTLIVEHHSLYVSLYGPGEFIPKTHFLTHYPDQMEHIGPIVQAWTMWHEAKLKFFQTSFMCFKFQKCGSKYWQKTPALVMLSVGKMWPMFLTWVWSGDNPSPLSSEPDKFILCSDPTLDASSSVFCPSWVRYEGVLYKANNCFLIKESDRLDPKFVKVEEMLVIGNCLLTFSILWWSLSCICYWAHTKKIRCKCGYVIWP